MDAQTQYEDIVRRASGILTSHKINTLHAAGLTIVSEKHLAALEQLAAMTREYTANWGRSEHGSFYRDEPAPQGTAEKMYKALEAIE